MLDRAAICELMSLIPEGRCTEPDRLSEGPSMLPCDVRKISSQHFGGNQPSRWEQRTILMLSTVARTLCSRARGAPCAAPYLDS
jgi:hypothetical protein